MNYFRVTIDIKTEHTPLSLRGELKAWLDSLPEVKDYRLATELAERVEVGVGGHQHKR